MPDDDEDEENESSIRRACSLSDLSMGKGNKVLFLCDYYLSNACKCSFHIMNY